MYVHMHVCGDQRQHLCTVWLPPLRSTFSLETGSLTDWTRLVPVSSRGSVVCVSPVQLQAAPHLASVGAGESNSCWCSQRFPDPLLAPGGASSVTNLTLGIMGASRWVCLLFLWKCASRRSTGFWVRSQMFTETTRKDQWESYDLICSSKAATLGQEETGFGGSAAQDSASQGSRTGACPSLQTRACSRIAVRPRSYWAKTKEPLHM